MICPACLRENAPSSKFCAECATSLSPSSVPTSPTITLPMPHSPAIPGTTFSPKYRILGEVGRGGMGIVLKAEDLTLKRTVALKVLPPWLTSDTQALERFVQEARAAAALDHPNICTVHEINEAEGRTFIAMAYIEGKSLRERILEGPLEIEEAVRIAAQVAEGLRAAHEKGIIHRDIKPANIMLAGTGLVKIMDFGLAKMEWGADVTKVPSLIGTVAYMSPEQAQSEKIDARADIWSLGCVLYEMLAGRRPFMGRNDQAILYAILHDPPAPIAGFRGDIPAGLEKILQTCLQKDPRNRYRDAATLSLALKAVDFGEPAASPDLAPPAHPVPSIAVLPFADMSPQKDQDYFCEGIADELINALTRIRELRVVARTSAFALKGMNLDIREIGRILNVKAVLEGSLRKSGNRLRIMAQMIDVENGCPAWSAKFDRDMDDIFAIQDEISLAIVDELKVNLLAGEKAALRKRHTDDPEVYRLYLKGVHYLSKINPQGLRQAMEFFRAAADKDPCFAPAYSGIANVYAFRSTMSFAPAHEMWPKAKAAFQKALELDPDLGDAHTLAATCALWYDLDWETAERSFQRTLELNPGNAMAHGQYAWFCLHRKRFDETLREIKIAQSLDPLMPLFSFWAVATHVVARKPDAALEEFRKAVELDPKSSMAYFHAGLAYMQKKLYDEAIAAFLKAGEFGIYPGWMEANLARAYLAKGDVDKSNEYFERTVAQEDKNAFSAINNGWLWGIRGELDRAFECFDKGFAARDTLAPLFHVYTELQSELSGLDPIRRDPRYPALLKKWKLDF
jgi:serine/threonine protein kinase/tetratricopeptide (TPR) repeat protein